MCVSVVVHLINARMTSCTRRMWQRNRNTHCLHFLLQSNGPNTMAAIGIARVCVCDTDSGAIESSQCSMLGRFKVITWLAADVPFTSTKQPRQKVLTVSRISQSIDLRLFLRYKSTDYFLFEFVHKPLLLIPLSALYSNHSRTSQKRVRAQITKFVKHRKWTVHM